MGITYRFRMDAGYYRAVIDRFYRQRPLLLRLPVRFAILSAMIAGLYLYKTAAPLKDAAGIALIIAGLVFIVGPWLTKRAILMRFRYRADFGTEATVSLSNEGLTAGDSRGQRQWAWSAYPRSVRYADGILLLRAGVIRWLPDLAIQSGTEEGATALVRTKTALRNFA